MGYNTRGDSKNQETKPHSCMSPVDIQKLISESVLKEVGQLLNRIKVLEEELADLKKINADLINRENIKDKQATSEAQNNIEFEMNELDNSTSSSETVVAANSYAKTVEKPPSRKVTITKSSSGNVKKRDGVYGTAKVQGQGLAAERRLWLYVGRCRTDVTEDELTSFLGKKSPGYTFEVTKLHSQGKSASFRVSASYELRDTLYDPSFWPENILVRRFNFFRKGNPTGQFD